MSKLLKTAVKCAFLGFAAGLFLKLFAVDILTVSGKSMLPTLRDGQIIAVSKLAYGPVKPFGDSVFFNWNKPKVNDIITYLHDGNLVVKRCAAVSGNTLEFSLNSGYNLIVGSKKYPLSENQYHLLCRTDRVPEGTVLALGDNPAQSVDSRAYGFVPEKNVIGRVIIK